MKLHLNKKLFRDIIDTLNTRTGIAIDIIEKDYYVCILLKELSKRQNELKAYFKGGTAIYKILNTMNRFSEDIDLTVKVLTEESNTRNKKRLKQSALGYNIEGLELIKEECIDNKGSITGMYRYNSVYSDSEIPLQRAGKIQVEATSFTVSEPTEKYYIESLIYKLANNSEKKILEEQFDVSKIEIEIIKLERMFIDKIFAAEFYYIRDMYMDTAKHIYDISILFYNEKIQNLLNNDEELNKLIKYKRQEEKARIGGIDENTQIKNFNYLKLNFSYSLIKEFENIKIDLDSQTFFGGLKTAAGKGRTVPIHPRIIPLVQEYVENPISTAGTFRQNLYQAQDSLHWGKHTPHDFRHTFSWLCDTYNVDSLSKKIMLGHSLGKDVTDKVYGHRTLEQLRAEIEKIQ